MRSPLLACLAFYSASLCAASINVPQFGDFPSEDEVNNQRPAVDLSSNRFARSYRTTIRKAAGSDPSFASHYVVAWWSCGNECGQLLVVDLNTGKIYGLASSEEPVESHRGISMRVDSKLLIVDPPCDDGESCLSHGNSDLPVRYYVIGKNGLRLIKELPCKVVKGKECWRPDRG